MSDSVKVPVDLVVDLDTSKINLGDFQKDIEAKLSNIKSVMKEVFSGIDASKATKPLLNGVKAVESGVLKLEKANNDFSKSVLKAAKSTDGYKELESKVKKAQHTLDMRRETLNAQKSYIESPEFKTSGAYVQDQHIQQYNQYVREYNAQLQVVNELQDQLNSRVYEFAKAATGEPQIKLTEATRNLATALSGLSQAAGNFDDNFSTNKTSQEYQELEKQATKLTEKLKENNEKSKELADSPRATVGQWENLQRSTKKTSSELDSILRKMRELVKSGNALAVGDDTSGLTAQIKSMDTTRRNIAGHGSKLGTVDARANEVYPYSVEYEEELKNFEKIEQAIEKLNAKYKELHALGKLTPDGLAKMKYEAEQLQGKLDTSGNELLEMVNNGSAFKLGQGDVKNELEVINGNLNESKIKLNEIAGASANFGTSLRSVGPAITHLSKSVNNLAKGFLKALTGCIKLGKQGKSTGKGLSGVFNKLQKNVLMYGLGFRTAYYAIKRLRTLFIKEFQLMAQSSDEMGSQVRSLTMSFNRLKGTLGVAFQPLANVVIPILKTAMDYLTGLLETVGRFMATLTGQSYVFKAVAKNIDSVGESAKEAKKQLGSYDKLDVISKDNGSDGGDDLGVDYEKVGLDGGSNFAKMIKEAWEKQDFTQVGLTIGNKLVEALNSVPWDAIREKAVGLANSIATAINGFFSAPDLGQSIGNSIANALGTAIDFAHKFITTINFEQIGQTVGNAINSFIDKMTAEDSWAKLGQSLSKTLRGIAESIKTALETVNWDEVGQSIGTYISNIEWGKVIFDFTTLVGAILKAIGEALIGWAKKDPLSAILVTLIVALAGALTAAAKVFSILKTFTEIKKVLGAVKGIPGGGKGGATGGTGGAAEDIGKIATDTEKVSGATSNLTSKLTSLIKNLALGLVVLLEIAAAAVIFVGAIWAIGKLLDEVRIAWEPVLEHGDTVTAAMLIGTALLVVIGAAVAGLGYLSTYLIGPLLLGIIVLVELGVAAAVFIGEVILIGALLQQVIKAWEPVLANSATVEYGIKRGTELLIAIGVVTALLGAATVATAGALPLAIALGTALLVELAVAFIEFCDSLIDVADKLQELAPVLRDLNGILPGLETDMHDFTEFMKGFTGEIVKFTGSSTISGISTTIGKVVSFFTADPIKTLQKEVDKQTGQFNKLVPALEKINPQIDKAIKLVGDYKAKMGSFGDATGSGSGGLIGSITGGAKTAVNGLLDMIERMTNGIIKGINALIRGLNKIKFDVPSWVPAIGGKKLGFNIKEIAQVSIPKLAQGAVIPPNREFLAMLGDQKHGTNIEAPLDTIKQALAEVMAEFGRGSNNPIILQLDGKTVAKVVWDEEAKYYKQTGKYSPAY
jgi:DNA repair ATPase RecN